MNTEIYSVHLFSPLQLCFFKWLLILFKINMTLSYFLTLFRSFSFFPICLSIYLPLPLLFPLSSSSPFSSLFFLSLFLTLLPFPLSLSSLPPLHYLSYLTSLTFSKIAPCHMNREKHDANGLINSLMKLAVLEIQSQLDVSWKTKSQKICFIQFILLYFIYFNLFILIWFDLICFVLVLFIVLWCFSLIHCIHFIAFHLFYFNLFCFILRFCTLLYCTVLYCILFILIYFIVLHYFILFYWDFLPYDFMFSI